MAGGEIVVVLAEDTAADQQLLKELAKYIQSLDKKPWASGDATPSWKDVCARIGALCMAPEHSLERAFNYVLALLNSQPKNVTEIADAVIQAVLASPREKVNAKLKVLVNLFHATAASGKSRAKVFAGLVRYATAVEELDRLYAQLGNLELWFEQWALTPQERRELYLLLSESMKTAKDRLRSQEYLVKYLATFAQGEAGDEKMQKRTLTAIVNAISIPDYFQFEDLLTLEPVQSLKKEKAFALLSIFVHDRLPKFQAFAGENANLLKTLAESMVTPLSYAKVAAELTVPEDDVEIWVIDGIRAGLIEGKMDQLNRRVIISRTTYRVFGNDEWKMLDEKLTQWQSGVDNILRVLDNATQMAESVPVIGK